MTEPAAPLDHARLKARQREIRAGFPEALGLRVHRAISWQGRAERETADDDLRFILLWIGFNAAYAAEIPEPGQSERLAFGGFFGRLVRLDAGHRIYGAVWTRFPHEIRALLGNRYVFAPFWAHHNGDPNAADLAERMARAERRILRALETRDTGTILSVLFDRLYVLRNQLVHGGATWNSGVNRDQLRDGARVLGWLLPLFIEIMMENPAEDWGRPHYPVVD